MWWAYWVLLLCKQRTGSRNGAFKADDLRAYGKHIIDLQNGVFQWETHDWFTEWRL